jgi:hypothetical protein
MFKSFSILPSKNLFTEFVVGLVGFGLRLVSLGACFGCLLRFLTDFVPSGG